MMSRIIYWTAVLLATAAVILLALFSPVPHRKNQTIPRVTLSFYIQQPQAGGSGEHRAAAPPPPLPPSGGGGGGGGALIFHRMLTDGPENTSRVVGRAQGFIIPVESFAHSAFNIIYLTFHTPEYSGSISIEAKNLGRKEEEELNVVGGTGSFAFARGLAFFAQIDHSVRKSDLDATHRIKLQLKFPSKSQIIPG